MTPQFTYIGGPTARIDFHGLRVLTDPTFDAVDSEYKTPIYTLRKTQGPAIAEDAIGPIDLVLLSHDHHFDNLDRRGRAFLPSARQVFTTIAGAERLGGNAVGLAPWDRRDLSLPNGEVVRVTATPARHGPADGDRGPVIGFVLEHLGDRESAVYVTGDTVWYDAVPEVARRFHPTAVVLFAGAARVPEVGKATLTLTAIEAVEVAKCFSDAVIVPIHFEGWAHFSESREVLAQAFAAAGLGDRLRWPVPGEPVDLAGPALA